MLGPFLLALALLASPLSASSDPASSGPSAAADDSTTGGGPPVLQARRAGSAPTVDGRLDEPVWDTAPAATRFRQLKPNEGTAPSQRTAVRVVYGDDALYVGARLYDDRPGRIRDRLTRRDQRNEADWFEISIDSYADRQTARAFAVNAAGVQRDGVVRSGTANRRSFNASWDAIWTSAVRIGAKGWVAEMRIPYEMLRFSEADRQTWGVQFRRRIPRTGELLEWPLVPQAQRQASLVAEYGRLSGLQNLTPDRRLQAAPYVLSRARTPESGAGTPPLNLTTEFDAGVDAQIGLGPNSTLDATINPDFGQVESDPSVLNLTAFQTFFKERRPFFIEGTDVFDFPLGRLSELFYTRRIGASAPVLGALKLTGRTREGLSYGALSAATGEAFTPRRGYAVGRVEQQLGDRSAAGGMLTATTAPSGSDGARRQESLAGGVDWDLRFRDGAYRFEGVLSGTHRQTETPTTGWSALVEVERLQGDWTYDVGARVRSDDFDPNDLGKLRRNNQVRLSGFLRHQFNSGRPFGPFRGLSGFLFLGQSWSYDRGLDRGMEPYLEFTGLTDGFHPVALTTNVFNAFGGVDLFETRGLWPRARPTSATSTLSIGTDSRRDWQVTPSLSVTPRTDGGRSWSGEVDASWNVASRLKLSGSASYSQELGVVEWAANETFVRRSDGAWAVGTANTRPSDLDAGDLSALSGSTAPLARALADVASTGHSVDGNPAFYVPVYGRRDTEKIDVTLRANVAMTQTLSFEFFGQLFAARGRYRDFQILSSRNDLDAVPNYPKRHDFARSSFIANAVLRWEFRPGSELFAVWSQNRRLRRTDPFFRNRRASSPYTRAPARRLTDAFRTPAANTFILKLRYTLR